MESQRQKNNLDSKAHHLRTLVLEVMRHTGAGHLATAFSCAEILSALYYGNVLRFDSRLPDLPERDRFFMSKGHAATILYCVLADLGYFPLDDLWKTCAEDGTMGVHLQTSVPGIEATSGSLGNGLGIACGVGFAAKKMRENYLAYVLLGDGELNEGSVWESLLFAAHHRLNNVVAIVDRNHMCCADYTENCLSLEPLDAKFEAFGWSVRHVDGHDCASLVEELRKPRQRLVSRPTCIIAHTVKGKGLPSVENGPMCHHYSPKGEALADAFDELNGEGKYGNHA